MNDFLDLAPAKWIWLPSQRTLANTFLLFRREVDLPELPVRATGWVLADSRYRLTLNGSRIQWGPAPCDPRYVEADPIDLTSMLRPGRNVLGAEVLYYGTGDGTWPMGKPGFLLRLDMAFADGHTEQVVTDESWQVFVDRAHSPGQYRRWFLRALQEIFDARLHPYGWDDTDGGPGDRWISAMVISDNAHLPPIAGTSPDYLSGINVVSPETMHVLPRQIPMMSECEIPAHHLAESGRVVWKRDPEDWFEFRVPDAFQCIRQDVAEQNSDGSLSLPACPSPSDAYYLTFEWQEESVGWPYLVIEAPEGTIIEIVTQESHDPSATQWLDTQFFAWSRLTCKQGRMRWEAFDFEAFKWMQLHIRNASGTVVLHEVGMRRRQYPWPNDAAIHCDDVALQSLFNATLNTLDNSAQETCADGMARERQQYSGDCSQQLYAMRYAFGETTLPARFLRTYNYGMTPDGYYLDCWPACDRLARVAGRMIGATEWGPLLDHGITFGFDNWHHYWETGDISQCKEAYPALKRMTDLLISLRDDDGLLPVENIGVPSVWMDHDAYQQQRHKQCAFNLFASAMLANALAPMSDELGEPVQARTYRELANSLLAATIDKFWCQSKRAFVNNLPWIGESSGPRYCDRSLATAILFDQCPKRDTAESLRILAETPPELGLSYPANAFWRLRALAKSGRIDVVIDSFRSHWATMGSVSQNNTVQETWHARTDSMDEWSHSAVAPLNLLYMDIAGIQAASPGFREIVIRPQLGDITHLDVTAHTVRGPIAFEFISSSCSYQLSLSLPEGCSGELLLPDDVECGLPVRPRNDILGLRRYTLTAATKHEITCIRTKGKER